MSDLTISEILNDPMIDVMLNADGISRNAFAQLLESASRVLALRKSSSGIRLAPALGHCPHLVDMDHKRCALLSR
ncbi:hypothetical protein ACC761_36195 [Rhizobium ruizarguesonis]|uniref:Uncharacterized protein n=1 Tax=Rhizobium ruizarguesonis TaxID=2081791 RepID=A0AB38HR14_9HYPH|nr:hypothetical protein [Rhizobium ruizarguesonis]TBC01450.1 hypothetical protein ELH40_38410 [Rhizobium ruizarguesonis]